MKEARHNTRKRKQCEPARARETKNANISDEICNSYVAKTQNVWYSNCV